VRFAVDGWQPEYGSGTDVGSLAMRGPLVTHLEADMFPGGLTITSHDPDTTTTAYGMFADFLNVSRSDRTQS